MLTTDVYAVTRDCIFYFRKLKLAHFPFRMRFLVKRWHRATGMSSTTSCSVNKNGAGQSLGNQSMYHVFCFLHVSFRSDAQHIFYSSLSGTEVRDSPYLHPGSVDMYRERGSGGGGGVSSSRGRSGRESPRSAISSTQHRCHINKY